MRTRRTTKKRAKEIQGEIMEIAGDAYEKDNEEESERSLPEQKGAADLIKESEQLHEPGDQARSGRSGEVIRNASS